MLWDMHLCVFDVRLSFENRVAYYTRCVQVFRFPQIQNAMQKKTR